MYYTEKEIFSQYEALEKSLSYLKEQRNKIESFLKEADYGSLVFTGSGSSYSLCRSGEMSVKVHTNYNASAVAAGDLMLNYPHYKNIIKNSLLIAPSRSGSTSEVIKSVKKAKKDFDIPVLSISANEDSDLSRLADFNLALPWAFDESVCQTRTVTNLYLTQLFIIAILSEKENLIKDIEIAVSNGEDYIAEYKDTLEQIGKDDSWDKVIVLGDSELEGIADEAAIAFKEIPRIPSNYYHILDVRHGPMVLVDNKTLVILACSPFDESYQQDLIRELQEKGAQVVTCSYNETNIESDYNIEVEVFDNYGVMGIPFILVPQVIAFKKAMSKNINPDKPESLDPWIEL